MPRVMKRSSSVRSLVEDAERGVAGAGELAGRLEHAAEHGVEIEIGDDEAPDVDQGFAGGPDPASR